MRTTTTAGTPQELRFGVSYRAGDPTYETTALQFRAAAEQAGIVVELRPTEQSVLSRQLQTGETDMCIRNFTGNPFSFDFTALLHSKGIGAGNTTGFSSASTDRLIEQITSTENARRKEQLLRKFQRVMAEEVPFIVLYFLRYRIAAAQTLGQVPVMGLRPGYEAARIRPAGAAR